ncbi:urease accessory protein UreD [Motiliproteus sp. SC1-56]|uniref:urease accessory protein UreD n=1 Tax=Motiliproteus sp. SC1-56 TaxID=2799565 RepID=UPI001A8DD3BC|nr:urease accessory protein UreD [Motiliproteus sp. SC1-56]
MNQALVQPETVTAGYGRERRWCARLTLGFEPRHGRTALPHLAHEGPLRVQRPFYPEGPVCHVYLLHPPGGLVSGDQLAIGAELAERSGALITTPSAGKIYKGDSCGVSQYQQVNLRLAADSTLEWLPQETILYDGALGHSDTRVDLTGNARFVGWELICLGRPASRIRFDNGRFVQKTQLYRDGLPLLLEQQHLQAGSALANECWGLQGYPQVGSLYAVGFNQEPSALLEQLRASLEPLIGNHLRVAITWRRGVLVARLLGQDSEQARHCFTRLWQQIRPALLQREALIPRIWLT